MPASHDTLVAPDPLAAADSFGDLIARARRGDDDDAAARLVGLFQPEIHRFVRYHLTSLSLRRVFESLDVCQSVLAKFFVDLEAGEFRLDDPTQLRKLLVTMARNKLYDRVREHRAARRDVGRVHAGDPDEALRGVADAADSPSETVAGRELVELLQGRLSDDERYLIDQRLSGRGWKELAVELGCEPDAVRKRTVRALDRASAGLGFAREEVTP